MTQTIKEGDLTFVFADGTQTCKYDDTVFYRKQFQSFGEGCKGVDLLCREARTVWLIEVKDYRHHERVKSIDLCLEVAQKVRDTLAGLAVMKVNSRLDEEKRMARQMLNAERFRVVLQHEVKEFPSRLMSRRKYQANMQDKLSGLVRAVDAHPKVWTKKEISGWAPWQVT